MIRHRLDDSTWDKVYAYLKMRPKLHTGNEATCRIFVDAVHWIMRTGAQWRDVPAELGKRNTVFKRFARWSDKGIWAELHTHFIDEPDMEWLLIDSTVVRAHPCAAGAPKENGGQEEQALGKSVGGSFHGLRNMPRATWLFSALPLLLSGFVKYVNTT